MVVGCQKNKSCSKVLNFLERLDHRIRCVILYIIILYIYIYIYIYLLTPSARF